MNWVRPDLANGIILRYAVSVVQQSGDEVVASESVTSTNAITYSIFIGNLQAFTSFTVTVFASTSVGRGEGMTVMTTTDPDSASPPIRLSATVVNSTAVLLAWGFPEVPRGEIVGYIVTVEGAGATEMFNITLNPINSNQNQSYLLDDLQPFTEYLFTVLAFSFGVDPFVIHRGNVATAMAMTSQAGNCGAFCSGILLESNFLGFVLLIFYVAKEIFNLQNAA